MMRIVLEDTSFDLIATLEASGGYNPDALDDMKARAVDLYQSALATKVAITQVAAETDDTD